MLTTDPATQYVADLMALEPVVVRESDTVEYAESLLRDFRISGLPVVDKNGVLVGVFSLTDVLYLQLPGVREAMHRTRPVMRVGEVMSSPAITVSSVSSIPAAAAVMLEHDVHRVVAVDDHGRPTGVLSSMDFVRLATE